MRALRRIITSDEVASAARNGGRIKVEGPYGLTDLARDLLRRQGVQIVQESPAAKPVPPAQKAKPAPAYVPAPAAVSAPAQPLADLLLRGGVVMLPEIGPLRTNLAVKNGKVMALSHEEIPAVQTIDARDLHILPGIIDPHTHIGLMAPPQVEWESESRSALIGGVTTVGCFLSQGESYLPTLRELQQIVGEQSRIDAFFHLTLREPGHLEELQQYRAMGISSFKMYMYGVPGVMPHQEDGFLVEAMEHLHRLGDGIVLCIHAENASMIDHLQTGPVQTLEDWAATHPDLSESDAVLRAAYLGREKGVQVYTVHVSTKDSAAILPRAKEDGLLVETTSPYLTLNHQNGPGPLGKMLPPFRGQESVDALWDAIKAGLIDTIGTDNVTLTLEQKQPQSMQGAFPGYPALATHLPSVIDEGVHRRGIPLEKLVPLMTMNPAKIFGIYPRKGTLLPGSDADLVLLDVNQQKAVDPQALCSRSDFSLYQGKSLRGWPRATIKGGSIVMWNGRIVDDIHRGTTLLR